LLELEILAESPHNRGCIAPRESNAFACGYSKQYQSDGARIWPSKCSLAIVTKNENINGWRRLATRISVETDSKKLSELIQQLSVALDREDNLPESRGQPSSNAQERMITQICMSFAGSANNPYGLHLAQLRMRTSKQFMNFATRKESRLGHSAIADLLPANLVFFWIVSNP
jgi:hypothetical protein